MTYQWIRTETDWRAAATSELYLVAFPLDADGHRWGWEIHTDDDELAMDYDASLWLGLVCSTADEAKAAAQVVFERGPGVYQEEQHPDGVPPVH